MIKQILLHGGIIILKYFKMSNWCFTLLVILVMFISGCSSKSIATLQNSHLRQQNFIAIRTNNVKQEVLVSQNGIFGLEVSISGERSGERNLVLRWASDGNTVVKAIYSERNTTKKCDIEETNMEEIDSFLQKFVNKKEPFTYYDLTPENNIVEQFGEFQNVNYKPSDQIQKHSKLMAQFMHLLDLNNLKTQCTEDKLEENNKYKSNKGE